MAAETRHCLAIQSAGEERAAQVREGMVLGSECTNDWEPHILSIALTTEKVWEGDDGTSWMGTIKAGNDLVCLRA